MLTSIPWYGQIIPSWSWSFLWLPPHCREFGHFELVHSRWIPVELELTPEALVLDLALLQPGMSMWQGPWIGLPLCGHFGCRSHRDPWLMDQALGNEMTQGTQCCWWKKIMHRYQLSVGFTLWHLRAEEHAYFFAFIGYVDGWPVILFWIIRAFLGVAEDRWALVGSLWGLFQVSVK